MAEEISQESSTIFSFLRIGPTHTQECINRQTQSLRCQVTNTIIIIDTGFCQSCAYTTVSK